MSGVEAGARRALKPWESIQPIFIFNFQVQPSQSIYIKARLSTSFSVLMAEAASLALAATILQQ
jgi:hypothetical protein